MRTALALAGLAAGLLTALPGPAEAAGATCDGLRATIVGTSRADVLRGSQGRDVIAGLGGNDRLLGLGGDDVLCGGEGYDVLEGGEGDDRLLGGLDGFVQQFDADFPTYVGDRLAGGPGDDHLDAGRDPRPRSTRYITSTPDTYDVLDFSGSPVGVDVDLRRGVATGEGRDTIVAGVLTVLATRHDDTVRGGKRALHAVTGAGDDTIIGSPRGDYLLGDAGSTSVYDARKDPRIGHGGTDTVDGRGGADDIEADRGRDVLRGGGGRDEVSWSGGKDVPVLLDGGPGRDDVLVSRLLLTGPTTITAGPGSHAREKIFIDVLGVGALSWDLTTSVLLVDGQDRGLRFGNAGDVFFGGPLRGPEPTLTVTGTALDDDVSVDVPTVFRGLGGADRFSGSTKPDTFDGGEGTDTFNRDGASTRGLNTCVSVERDPDGSCA